MGKPLPRMDSLASFEMIKAQVEDAVKAGKLPTEQAAKIIREAREAYRSEAYNRRVDAENRYIK